MQGGAGTLGNHGRDSSSCSLAAGGIVHVPKATTCFPNLGSPMASHPAVPIPHQWVLGGNLVLETLGARAPQTPSIPATRRAQRAQGPRELLLNPYRQAPSGPGACGWCHCLEQLGAPSDAALRGSSLPLVPLPPSRGWGCSTSSSRRGEPSPRAWALRNTGPPGCSGFSSPLWLTRLTSRGRTTSGSRSYLADPPKARDQGRQSGFLLSERHPSSDAEGTRLSL